MYTVIVTKSIGELETEIAKKLQEGWKCQGGIYVLTRLTTEGENFISTLIYFQALVKQGG